LGTFELEGALSHLMSSKDADPLLIALSQRLLSEPDPPADSLSGQENFSSPALLVDFDTVGCVILWKAELKRLFTIRGVASVGIRRSPAVIGRCSW
jgi:hypothetical protein